MQKRILVFPCGSEIGLEIYRSMRYSSHFELVGASSVDDHGRFVYEEYVGGLPFHTDERFPTVMAQIVRDHRINAIYPTMDAVSETLTRLSSQLGVTVIGSSIEATAICASKTATYEALKGVLRVPDLYPDVASVPRFPVFIKPDRGYGARNTLLANSAEEACAFLKKCGTSSHLLVEQLPGHEWTVDCFSDRHGKLLFNAPRIRGRISNGISVYTRLSNEHAEEFSQWASRVNEIIHPRGAWFFQAKNDASGRPKLLEVAARLGGSSGLLRGLGVNFALLSVFDAFNYDVSIRPNTYQIEMDRALDCCYRLKIEYDVIYVDLDDCLIIKNAVNHQLVAFLYKAVTARKTVVLLTRHYRDPLITLKQYRITELFDRVVHINDKNVSKSDFIDEKPSILIDDSHSEREDVAKHRNIPVFSPDMVEILF